MGSSHTYAEGDLVRVHYMFQPTIEAIVVDAKPMDRRYNPRPEWITVEQVTDFEDQEKRPRFDACIRYVTPIEGQ